LHPVPDIHRLEIEGEFARHRNIRIPAPNTSSCVLPLSRYYLLCLNRAGMQAGKSRLR